MARITEPEKIENIKKAVMEAVIEHGYTGMSIASISEKARVSQGYLYRFYKSKEELVQDIVDAEMGKIVSWAKSDIDSSESVYEAAVKIISRLFMEANREPLVAKFISAIMLDTKIPSRDKTEILNIITDLTERFIKLGKATGEIHLEVTLIELWAVSFTIPFRYLSVYLDFDKDKKFTEAEAERIAKMCVNALQ
jgi:AcrR family transcriptional regulator